jgi:hypothetical protein
VVQLWTLIKHRQAATKGLERLMNGRKDLMTIIDGKLLMLIIDSSQYGNVSKNNIKRNLLTGRN